MLRRRTLRAAICSGFIHDKADAAMHCCRKTGMKAQTRRLLMTTCVQRCTWYTLSSLAAIQCMAKLLSVCCSFVQEI